MVNPHPASTPIDFAAMGAPSRGPGFEENQRRRLPSVWLVVFVALVVGGGVALVSGIVDIVGQNGRVLDAAVAEGRADTSAQPVSFVATSSREFFVYAIIDSTDSDERDFIVADTTCTVQFADDSSARLRGSQQSSSVTIGDTSTVGSFTAPEGQVTIACVQNRDGSQRYIVSTGTFGVLKPVALIVSGGFALVASVFAGLAAARARRRRTGTRHPGWTPTA